MKFAYKILNIFELVKIKKLKLSDCSIWKLLGILGCLKKVMKNE